MAQRFFTTGTTSDITNATAVINFITAFNVIGGVTTTGLSAIASGGTQVVSFFTPPLHPGLDGNITGNYSFLYTINTANNNISGTCILRRVNSAGVVQTSSAASASQSFGTTGTKTYSFTNLSLGTFLSTDRIRIDITATNGAMNNQSYGIVNNNGIAALNTPSNARFVIFG